MSAMVGERSMWGEGRSKELLDCIEVSMPVLVTINGVKNFIAENLRFPGQC